MTDKPAQARRRSPPPENNLPAGFDIMCWFHEVSEGGRQLNVLYSVPLKSSQPIQTDLATPV